jgi:ubiquinone/menaquinone biosynthesis C-methylase UbiE
MNIERIIAIAHLLIGQKVKAGMTVVDATAGNGHDVTFLAEAVGPSGHVVGFDLHASAIEESKRRTASMGFTDRVTLHQACHSNMCAHISEASADVILFNLGYLPGADRDTATQSSSTLEALRDSLRLLRPGGLLSIVVYPGHPEGQTEATAIDAWIDSLGEEDASSASYRLHHRPHAPYVVLLQKSRT